MRSEFSRATLRTASDWIKKPYGCIHRSGREASSPAPILSRSPSSLIWDGRRETDEIACWTEVHRPCGANDLSIPALLLFVFCAADHKGADWRNHWTSSSRRWSGFAEH